MEPHRSLLVQCTCVMRACSHSWVAALCLCSSLVCGSCVSLHPILLLLLISLFFGGGLTPWISRVASVPVDQDPGNTEGANEAEPAAEEGAPTGEEPAEDLTEAVEQASQKLPTPMGSLAGEVVGDRSNPPGSAIAADDENTGGKAERIVFSNIVNPLGEWIRFGRAGFRFHIIDSHPDVYNASKPA